MNQENNDPPRMYHSRDMAMVAFLKYEGHEVQDITWDNRTCQWSFVALSSLLEAVEAFLTGSTRVEPQKYNQKFAETKREFHQKGPRKS